MSSPDEIQPGALPHERPCSHCGHFHVWMPCDCGCPSANHPGID